ncbi:MAG: ABC transporter permease subunit [Marinosulfonomonas sp.]|nr:ABC transporter permease subunit [Marinosulfonomonas sp.]
MSIKSTGSPGTPSRFLKYWHRHNSTLLGLGIFAFLLAIWEASISLGWVSKFVLTPPSGIIQALIKLSKNGELMDALATTLTILGAALGLALVIGISIGFLLYKNELWGKAFEPLLGAIFASPLPLMFPIFLVLFGRTFYAIICLATIYGSIPIIMNTREALLSVRRTLIWVGRSFRLTEVQIFWKIIVPAAAPLMFSGIRMGLIYALLGVVAFEFLTDLGGLGRLLSELNYKFKIPESFALTASTVMLSGFVLFLTGWIERRISNNR